MGRRDVEQRFAQGVVQSHFRAEVKEEREMNEHEFSPSLPS